MDVRFIVRGFAPGPVELPPGQYPGRLHLFPHATLNSEQKLPVAFTDTVIAHRLAAGHKDEGGVEVPAGGLHANCSVYPEGAKIVPALSHPHSANDVTVRALAAWPLLTKSFAAAC